MCEFIEHPNVAPGWGCCRCHTYNGIHRDECKKCGERHCPLEEGDDVLAARREDADSTKAV